MIFSLMLGTGLRLHEVAALNVGDIFDGERIARRFALRVFKRAKSGRTDGQEAILPDSVRYKLEKFMRWKRLREESLEPDAPLFMARGRISTRAINYAFTRWQDLANFERHMTVHSLRHTALSNLYQVTLDIRLVQRVARHANVASTTIYAQANDDDVLRAVRALPC